jgi:hypothetical protein
VAIAALVSVLVRWPCRGNNTGSPQDTKAVDGNAARFVRHHHRPPRPWAGASRCRADEFDAGTGQWDIYDGPGTR